MMECFVCDSFLRFVFQDSSKTSRKVSDKWALPLNKRVGVSACKQHMPDTHVFVPTLHKLFLLIYWKLKRYEHLTLTTNQLVESSFLCFQNNAFCLKCTDPQMLDQKSNDWRSIFLWLNIVLNLKRK